MALTAIKQDMWELGESRDVPKLFVLRVQAGEREMQKGKEITASTDLTHCKSRFYEYVYQEYKSEKTQTIRDA